MSDDDERPSEDQDEGGRRGRGSSLVSPGSGPLYVAGVMVGAAVLLSGAGLATMAVADDDPSGPPSSTPTAGPSTSEGSGTAAPSGTDSPSLDKGGTASGSPSGVDDSGNPERSASHSSGTQTAPRSESGQGSSSDDSRQGQQGRQKKPGTVTMPDADRNGVADALEDARGSQSTGSSPGPSDLPNGTWIYRIQAGDTLSSISGETGVPIGHLISVNRIEDVNLIYAGASLRIPSMK